VLAEFLNLAQRDGNRQFIGIGLLLAARYAARSGALVRAIRLFAAADIAVPDNQFEWDLTDAERADYTRSLAAARAAMPEDTFAAEWAAGQAMTLDEAIAYAVRDDTNA
jgi:hypothetical protein